MRSDGRIERWNELGPISASTMPVLGNRDRVQRTAGASSVSRFWMLLEMALREHQTWFIISPLNPRMLIFPFAWYIEKGMIIKNVSRNSSYKVEDVIITAHTLRGGEVVKVNAVVISGGEPPKETDRLVFPEDKYLVFRPSRARAWADPENYGNRKVEGQDPKTWNNTITYYLVRRESGSIGDRPFGAHRERRPRFRSFDKEFQIDPTTQIDMHGQVFDNIAQFDCWSKEASEADLLVDYFEHFLKLWTGVIAYNGIERIWYWSRGMDAVETSWRNDIAVRSLQYFFRTEDVTVSEEFLYRGFSVVVSTTGTLTTSATGISPITGDINFEII